MILNFGKANANVFIKEHATKLQLFLFTTKKSGTTPWPQHWPQLATLAGCGQGCDTRSALFMTQGWPIIVVVECNQENNRICKLIII